MTAAIIKIALRSSLLLAVAGLLLAAAVLAGKPVGITFAQGAFNLTIDSAATYNGAPVPGLSWDLKNLVPGVDKFFDFSNLLPGDQGQTTISLHVNEDAWVCLAFDDLVEADNGENEPEDPVDPSAPPNNGELAQGTEFFAWRDDGDNVFEVGELPLFPAPGGSVLDGGPASLVLDSVTYALADAGGGLPIPGGQTRYVGVLWCAGNLTVNLATAAVSCDGAALGNIAQTDSFSVGLSIQAAAAAEQPNFRCATGGEPPPPPPPPPNGQGLGEQIGLFVKCQTIAKIGWPLPKYTTECPGGFGAQPTVQAQPAAAVAPPPPAAPPPRTRDARPTR